MPARYGGFETCVEEVGRRLAQRRHEVRRLLPHVTAAEDPSSAPADGPTIWACSWCTCRRCDEESLETLSHTALSVAHLMRHPVDAAIVFNAANAPLLPVLRARRIPVATHVDGLEWQRAKWGRRAGATTARAESLAVRWSDALIADAQGIADYYGDEFGAPTDLIAYGAPILTEPAQLTDWPRSASTPVDTTWSSPGSSPRTTST